MATPDQPDMRLLAAIQAGSLDHEQTPGRDLEQAFAAHKKLNSLFALLRQPSSGGTAVTSGPRRHPTKIDRFLIRRMLGQGGFGTVYLADDPKLNRKVAIKVAHSNRFSSSHDVDRFLQEARFNASLNHPGIVRVYDMGRAGDYVYIVLEYVPGQTLENVVARGPLPPADAANLIAQIADALHYAHQKRCYHRDLKSSNILFDEQGRPRIADFGLALSEEQQDLETGRKVGTPAYMSPEQVRGETHKLDGRTDIWSLGVIFYQLLTRRQPFWTGDLTSSLDRILTRSPQPPRQVNDAVPVQLERICLKALSKEPAERYTTAGDMAKDLRAAIAPSRRRRQIGILASIGVAIVVLGLVLYSFSSAWRKAESPAQGRLFFKGAPEGVVLRISGGTNGPILVDLDKQRSIYLSPGNYEIDIEREATPHMVLQEHVMLEEGESANVVIGPSVAPVVSSMTESWKKAHAAQDAMIEKYEKQRQEETQERENRLRNVARPSNRKKAPAKSRYDPTALPKAPPPPTMPLPVLPKVPTAPPSSVE